MKRNSQYIIVFLLIVAGSVTVVWMIQPSGSKAPTELAINEALVRLSNHQFKEVNIKSSSIEFTDFNDDRFVTTIGSDATRELIVSRIDEINKNNAGTSQTINVSEAPASSGLGWLILAQSAPFLILFATIGLALGLLASLLLRK